LLARAHDHAPSRPKATIGKRDRISLNKLRRCGFVRIAGHEISRGCGVLCAQAALPPISGTKYARVVATVEFFMMRSHLTCYRTNAPQSREQDWMARECSQPQLKVDTGENPGRNPRGNHPSSHEADTLSASGL
jgi:hypothetical protein